MASKLFNKYIEMEQQLGNVDQCRKLYDKYIEWSPRNCNAWIKFAEFEAQAHRDGLVSATQEERKLCIKRARRVFERADTYFTTTPAASAFKDEICMLLQQWSGKEVSFGDLGDVTLSSPGCKRSILALDSIACSFLEYEADDKPLEATNAIISDACALETLKIASRSSKTLI
ncbi:hypothetical protein ACLB2K_072488 [Fragaria x ananassa]